MYKVFFEDNAVFIASQLDQLPNYGKEAIGLESSFDLDELLFAIKDDTANSKFYIYADDFKPFKKLFKSRFKLKKAAGGLVRNQKREVLIIKRMGRWDLPKGHIEPGEKKTDAAIREVEEECGISGLKIVGKLPKTRHVFEGKSGYILKYTNWYQMNYKGDEPLVPQTEEGIEEVRWVSVEEIPKIMQNTYPSLYAVFNTLLAPDERILDFEE